MLFNDISDARKDGDIWSAESPVQQSSQVGTSSSSSLHLEKVDLFNKDISGSRAQVTEAKRCVGAYNDQFGRVVEAQGMPCSPGLHSTISLFGLTQSARMWNRNLKKYLYRVVSNDLNRVLASLNLCIDDIQLITRLQWMNSILNLCKSWGRSCNWQN